MKKILIRFMSLILAVILVIGLSGCSDDQNVLTFLSYGKTQYAYDKDVNGVVCENDRWSLLWDDEFKRVSFLDKRTNTVWGQTPEEVIQKQNETRIVLPQMNSAVTVGYQDPVSLDEIFAYSYTSAYENGRITVKKLDNGIRVIYNFVEYEFSVPVEYTINEETFDIKIIPAHISQGEKFKVTSVKVAPFICGVQNDANDSWLFIPDGSGAIVEPFTSDTLGVFGEAPVYGHDLSLQLYGYSNKKQQVYMPVYGVKKGNNALLAVIDSSANAASVSWELGSSTFGCSTVYPTFRLRGTNLIDRPENFISITTLPEINIYTEGILNKEIRIKYYSLSDEEASISGMANCYRDYLIGKNSLKKDNIKEKTAMLKYVGGVVQPSFVMGVPSEKLFVLTSSESAGKMTQELTKSIGKNISVNLVGFGQSGVDAGKIAGGFKTASALGGNSGMAKLNNLLKDMGVSSYMDFDLITYNKWGNGFNKNSSAVYVSGEPVTYTGFDAVSHVKDDNLYYVLSRENLFKAAEKLTEKSKDMNLSGVALTALAGTSYSDYALQDYYACGKIEEDVAKIFKMIKKSGYNVLAPSANMYAAINSDEVGDVPLYSSNYSFTSYDVPFYQMVLKGYVPLSSVSLNLCADWEDALLRCVSSGIAPSYTLIENYDNSLVTSTHSFIHSSVYSSNKERIIEDINSVSNYLKSVQGAEIVEYDVLENALTYTEFSNGVWTVVNYSDSDVDCEYGNIPAKSFISGRDE